VALLAGPNGALEFAQQPRSRPNLRSRKRWRLVRGRLALDRFWHRAEYFGSATTSAAIWGYKRRAESVDAMPALDPTRTKLTEW
jgi:hypothetical protein